MLRVLALYGMLRNAAEPREIKAAECCGVLCRSARLPCFVLHLRPQAPTK